MEKVIKRISYLSLLAILIGVSNTYASDFNVPFISASGLGDLYSGWATSAQDASTSFSNPAGLTEIKNQQLVFAALGITGNTKFTGTTATPPYPFPFSQNLSGSSSSRIGALMPSFYYSVPINECLVFALGQTTPFALGTTYAKDAITRYSATRSKIVVIDVGPSVGYKLNDQWSLGLGLDIHRMAFTLENMIGPPISFPMDSEVQNHLSGFGYGWHGGVLYKILPTTRIGLSYNSRIMFHTTGDSIVYTPIGSFRTTNQKSNAALPARTNLSFQHDLTPCLTVLGSVFYTQWDTLDKLTLKRVAVAGGDTISVTIPFDFHNTFDYSVGLNYKLNTQWLLRTGFLILNTPSNERDRSFADPVGRAKIVGIGARYTQNPCLSYDVGIVHSFFNKEIVDNQTPLTSSKGRTYTQTSVAGLQVNWNIA